MRLNARESREMRADVSWIHKVLTRLTAALKAQQRRSVVKESER